MLLSRWKMMAGVLVMSLGGLAAMAGQCPKTEPTKGSPPPPDLPMTTTRATAPMTPPGPSLPEVPKPETAKPASTPPLLPVIPASGAVPPPPAEPVLPTTPPAPAALPVPPPLNQTETAPAADPLPNIAPPAIKATKPAAPPMSIPTEPVLEPEPVRIESVKPAAIVPASVPAAALTKYRILLRVGEGEPVFEVHSGDALMLKVVCEKVDVKSPEKGQGLSAVKACGKVRFAGFGAEGTCDELNFLAGTGEVAMTGNVRIQVKDKLGRVESELSAELMKYKIDPHTVAGNGQLKP